MLTLVTTIVFTGCKKDDPSPSTNNILIPIQTIVQAKVALAGASTIAVLAGSSVTNIGATSITGDLRLSPGTSTLRFKTLAIGAYFEKVNNEIHLKIALSRKRRKWFDGLWNKSADFNTPFVFSNA